MRSNELTELRRELVGVPRGRGRQYPARLRARITAWARDEVARGASVSAAAAAVALHPHTLTTWLAPTPSATAMVPVEVIASPVVGAAPPVTLVSPSGYRLEGLPLEDAVQLFARLA